LAPNEPQPNNPVFFLLFFLDGFYERPLVSPLALSPRLSVKSKIITRKTYVKELLQLNDVVILPHTRKKKKLVTLTDKAADRVQ